MTHIFNRRRFLQTMTVLATVPLSSCSWRDEPMPQVSSGRVERLSLFPSRYIDPRHVDVWLPDGYNDQTRHPVLYMHDGQAVFDGASAMSKTGWHIDQAIAAWAAQHQALAPIVVAVWSHDRLRHAEYFPQPMLDQLSAPARERAWQQVPLLMRPFAGELVKEGRSRSEDYLKFLVEELKPTIDQRYATRVDRDHTLIMGSSMGGLISVHALLSYPQTFAAAAALSTHWIGLFEQNDEISDAALAWLGKALPQDPALLRLYLDRGTIELDAHYEHAQQQVDTLLRSRGFVAPQVISRVIEGAGHNERDWAKRVFSPLTFLLDKVPSGAASVSPQ